MDDFRLNEMSKLLQEQPEDDEIRIENRKNSNVFSQFLSTTVVSWLSIVVGYASGYSSPSESTMVRELNLTKSETSWICSLLPVGAFMGSLSGGPFVEYFGRKNTLIFTDVIFLSAWSINYLSQNYWNMYLSRLLNGYSVGVTSFTLPVYLAETLQPTIRGRLGLFPTAFGNFGILICFISGNLFEWRELAGIGVILTLPFLVAVWVVPETPRWYISKKKLKNAQISLQWLRGKDCDIRQEFEDLQIKKPTTKCTKSNIKAFGIVLGLMFFQQFSGINAIIFYTTQIFEETSSSFDASICTAIVGIVNFVSTFIAAILVDRLGRKVLMYASSTIMGTMLAILGVYFYLLKVERLNLENVDWLPLSCFIFYVLGFSFGLGPIPWLMMGEILPAAIRGPAAAMAAAFNWSCTFIITKTFPLLVDLIGAHWVFWFFCLVVVGSMVFLRLVVPETKMRTLEDIERILAVK